MKRALSSFCLVLLTFWLAACGKNQAATESPKDSTLAQPAYVQGDSLDVSGLLVDTNCFAHNHDNLHVDHPDPVPTSQTGPNCARYCAKLGFPVAVLTDGQKNGKVWVLVTVGQALADYMGQTVRARGVIRADGILIPERMEVKSDEGWTFIL